MRSHSQVRFCSVFKAFPFFRTILSLKIVLKCPFIQLNRLALPIDDVADQILELLCDNDTCVILGETGCGKSTQIPQVCFTCCSAFHIAHNHGHYLS